jgi:hypothetical protein
MAARKTPSPGRAPGVKNEKRDPLFPPGAITKAHCELAHALALLGKDDRGVAAVFGVSERSLNDWKRDPLFKAALTDGKAVAAPKSRRRSIEAQQGFARRSERRLKQSTARRRSTKRQKCRPTPERRRFGSATDSPATGA